MDSINSYYPLKYLLLFFILCLHFSIRAQKTDPYFRFSPEHKTQVLVLGSFHFDYPGLDAHQIAEEDKIDVLKEPKKSEVTELVEYVKKFKPTKIAIEAYPKWEATKRLKKYKAGEYREKRDERYQLAMRIANDLDLDTLYSIDAGSMAQDILALDSTYSTELWKEYDFESDDPWESQYKQLFKVKDSLQKAMNLLDYFIWANSREAHQNSYGAYLIGDFKLDNNRGADILSYWWYNRNVRIFRKLQQISDNPEDRILVVFGTGHAAVLRQLLECSPEYEFVELDSLKEE